MTAIWSLDGDDWRLVAPSGFPAEEALHDLVEQAPNMLPLSGSPWLTVVGREVYLGSNKADLLALEPSGRIAIIEIKLKNNAEARRAVIAQILTYAAFLRGLSVEAVERDVLGQHLEQRGYPSLVAAVAGNDQSGAFEPVEFRDELALSLAEGRFRLILVLDDAPTELVQLVGYLEAVADKLVIDLVTVSAYDIGGRKVMVPQRIEPERLALSSLATATSAAPRRPQAMSTTRYIAGSQVFEESIEEAAEEQRPALRRLLTWARRLEAENLVLLETTIGSANRWALRLLLPIDKAGLVTVWNDNGAGIQFWRSLFEKRAPDTLVVIERLEGMPMIGAGKSYREIPDTMFDLLEDAYREAANGPAVSPHRKPLLS